jgi:hypothetical protein
LNAAQAVSSRCSSLVIRCSLLISRPARLVAATGQPGFPPPASRYNG